MLTRALVRTADVLLDRTVAPGFSRVGYRLRALTWSGDQADPAADALRGRTVAVTGAGGGLGLATAQGVARLGAAVRLVVRDPGRAEQARATIAASGADVAVVRCDLADLDDVRRAAPDLAGVDVLVHNAGVLPAQRSVTAQGHETTLATHVLGPHLLTRLTAPGRVIFVSSGGMYAQRLRFDEAEPYDGTTAYARTKRMQVVLAGLWARSGDAHAAHPGWADTPGLTRSLPGFARLVGPVLRSAAEGADTVVWLAAAPPAVAGTGRFWHDRRARPEHVLPWTRESAADRARLWELCERLTS